MKKHKAIYASDAITYWPSFVAGVWMMFFGGICILVYVLCLIIILLESENSWELVFLCPGLAFALWMPVLALRSMFCRVTVTASGFSIINKARHCQTEVFWEQVERVTFFQEAHFGRKQYRVRLKNAAPGTDIPIPICMVDEQKLRAMIPPELLTAPFQGN